MLYYVKQLIIVIVFSVLYISKWFDLTVKIIVNVNLNFSFDSTKKVILYYFIQGHYLIKKYTLF